jgi:parvulin-like peptidyl-prolyl isomerase
VVGDGGRARIEAAAGAPTVASLIIEEEMARRFAGELGVTATDQETRGELASRLGIAADDEMFDVAFQDELARSQLSETDYRELIEAAVLIGKLREMFLAEVPESTESVRYRQIVVGTAETAAEIREEIESGGDFAAVAAEHSLDTSAGDTGGEVGWVRRGVLEISVEQPLFDLETGEIATIAFHGGVLVVEMLEKDLDYPVEEDEKGSLAERAFDDWITRKRQAVVVLDNVGAGGDPYKVNWAIDRVTAEVR